MNANSKQPVPVTIDDWLASSTQELIKAKIPSARLDAELMLCHMLGVDRTWLIAHGDQSLARAALSHTKGVHPGGITAYGEKLVLKRLQRQPMAYLLGSKEFYGREFFVTNDVLIPRPETETLIDLSKKYNLGGDILDVGTGSGAIGLTLWHELSPASLTVTDVSEDALEIARKNAKKLKIKNVNFVCCDLLEHWLKPDAAQTFDLIVANLPYVDKSWERSPETNYEPRLALIAADGGLDLIKQLVDQAPSVLRPGGHLLLESDPEQQDDIIEYAKAHFHTRDMMGYGLLLEKL